MAGGQKLAGTASYLLVIGSHTDRLLRKQLVRVTELLGVGDVLANGAVTVEMLGAKGGNVGLDLTGHVGQSEELYALLQLALPLRPQ